MRYGPDEIAQAAGHLKAAGTDDMAQWTRNLADRILALEAEGARTVDLFGIEAQTFGAWLRRGF